MRLSDCPGVYPVGGALLLSGGISWNYGQGLRRLLRLVGGVGALPSEQLVDVLVKRHLDDCKHLADRILSNTNHPLYTALSPAI